MVNIINLIPSRPISIRLGSFDVFLLEINEFSRKKHCSALRIEILIVKVYLVKKPVIRYASIKTKSLIENDRKIQSF